jgi:hypothetical protein
MADGKGLSEAIDELGKHPVVIARIPKSTWPLFRRVGAELLAWAESVERRLAALEKGSSGTTPE